MKARPDATLLLLDSDGGFVDGALVLAHEVHDRGLDTYVPPGAVCLSACAFVFLAGADRAVDGKLGVHQIWNDENDLISGQAKLSDVLEAFQEFGVPRQIESIMLRTPPEQMYVFTAAEVEDLGLAAGNPFANPLEPAPANAEATEPGLPESSAKTEERLQASNDPAAVAGSQSLLLEDSDNANTGAVPFSGTVEWSRGTDETGLPTLLAKANIPARNLGVDLLIRKSQDPALPASPVIAINFTLQDSFIGGSIAGLPGVLMKNAELVQGTPLVGPSGVRVVANSFLFALSASPEDVATNGELMTTRKWMDLFLIYGSGKRAILTLEKDAEAEEMFKEVFAAWAAGSTPGPTAYIHLSSNRKKADAQQSLRDMSLRWSELFGNLLPEIEPADLGPGRGTNYRVRLPVPTMEEATRLCAEIKASGADCFVTH